ncbi:hypothetical protein OYE22_22345 [Streptomyces sp. 71268]|nr:hypothetical protein [Streptomyces sp. 71268]WEV27618.1 hypothetical protein OYE22_22345 [Streptomyces sp. 71268]
MAGQHGKPEPQEPPQGPPGDTDGQSPTIGGGDSGTHRKDDGDS